MTIDKNFLFTFLKRIMWGRASFNAKPHIKYNGIRGDAEVLKMAENLLANGYILISDLVMAEEDFENDWDESVENNTHRIDIRDIENAMAYAEKYERKIFDNLSAGSEDVSYYNDFAQIVLYGKIIW